MKRAVINNLTPKFIVVLTKGSKAEIHKMNSIPLSLRMKNLCFFRISQSILKKYAYEDELYCCG